MSQHETQPIDLHVDSIIANRLFGYRVEREHSPGITGQPFLWHADIPRMQKAGYRGACMGIHYFPWESSGAWQSLQSQLAYLDELVDRSGGAFRIRRPSDWLDRPNPHELGLTPAIEGAHMLAGKLDRVETLADSGVAYLTLTHFSKNSAATPSIGRGANENDGLTKFGRNLVRRLNKAGIAVDVAHVNTPGVLEACEVSKAPVLCTHTGLKGVYSSPRNITDAELDAIAETGGAVGIIFAPVFLSGQWRASSDCVVDHIEYAIERVGIRHVAVGSDYDGWIPSIPSDQRDCRGIQTVLQKLRRRGYSAEAVDRVAYRNTVRVFEEVDAAKN